MLITLLSIAAADPGSADTLLSGGGMDAVLLKGYLEVRGSWTDAEAQHGSLTERFRPTVTLDLLDRVSLTSTVEARLDQGRYATGEVLALFREPIESSLGGLSGDGVSLEEVIEACAWDLETERTYDEVSDVLSVERLYLDVNMPAADLRVGRQAVNWGSALYFNPTDIFSEILLSEPWQERAGVDAAKVNVPIGEEVMVSGIAAAVDEFQAVRGGLKGTVHVGTTDISLVTSASPDTYFAGIDAKGDLVAGWWIEGGLDGSVDGEAFPKVSVGLDYSLPVRNRLYIAGQVYYDGSGEIPALYAWDTRQDPTLAALTPCEDYPEIDVPPPPDTYRLTLGKWYGLAVLRLEASDYLTLTGTGLINMADGTGLLFPTAQYLIGGRTTLNAGVQYLFGSDGEFRPPDYQFTQNAFGIDLSPLAPTFTAMAWARFSL